MSITGSSSIRRLKDCPVVMDLHELSPVDRRAAGGRDGRWFGRFAEVCQGMTSRVRSHPGLRQTASGAETGPEPHPIERSSPVKRMRKCCWPSYPSEKRHCRGEGTRSGNGLLGPGRRKHAAHEPLICRAMLAAVPMPGLSFANVGTGVVSRPFQYAVRSFLWLAKLDGGVDRR
jgi:hypothetical protein